MVVYVARAAQPRSARCCFSTSAKKVIVRPTQRREIRLAAEDLAHVAHADLPVALGVEQGHRARCADRGGPQLVGMQQQETMREVFAAGEAEQREALESEPVLLRDLVDHRQ